MKKIASAVAFIAILAGCSGRAVHAPPVGPLAPHGIGRAPQSNGGPGTTSLTYLAQWMPYGGCHGSGLTILVGTQGSYPAPVPPSTLNFSAGQGPPLIVGTCNFSTPQYVKVTLGTPSSGTPYIWQSGSGPTVNVDAPAAAQVTATWTALGPTLPGTPGATGTVTFNIGPVASSTVLWKTGDPNVGYFATPAPGFPPVGDGQCGIASISGSNATFTVTRQSDESYTYDNNTFNNAASSCYRNQMNPTDAGGSNLLFTMGQQYTFTFQTVLTLHGNYVYQDYLPNGHLAVDVPAIVWQTHSYGENPGMGPCDILAIGNTYVDNVNGMQYPNVPAGGQPVWSFHTCSDSSSFTAPAYNSSDILYDGEVDNWQIDITAELDKTSGGSVTVHRNGTVVYNAASGVCDSTASNGCWWNFGPYMFYYETSEKPAGFTNPGITLRVNDMTWTTPNGGGGSLSRKRGMR